MGLAFIKMHGCGNDYVYVDGFRERVADPAALAVRVSDRHKGVGADGLILVLPSERPDADVRMRMWNADGSESEMCGNGVRCVAKLAREAGYAQGERLAVEVGREGRTRALEIGLRLDGERVLAASVDMGEPCFLRQHVPMLGEAGVEVVDEQITVPGMPGTPGVDSRFTVTCLSMGNPHCVVFVGEDPSDELVHGAGPRLETLAIFPARINVSFAHILGPEEIRLRVWERGSGETQACGTGASATVAAAIRAGRIPGPRALVHLPGGDLEIAWDGRTAQRPDATNRVRMTGPAVEVFRGVLSEA